jgi:hypothetical protein
LGAFVEKKKVHKFTQIKKHKWPQMKKSAVIRVERSSSVASAFKKAWGMELGAWGMEHQSTSRKFASNSHDNLNNH